MIKVEQLRALVGKVEAGGQLTADEMEFAIDQMTNGLVEPAAMGTFLLRLRERGETVDEVTGAARLLRARMTPVRVPAETIDIVGTGGDGHHTYNVSTAAAFVAAGAGVSVAKHGNRSVSSLSGASDVLAALGVKLDVPPHVIERAVNSAGVGFLWAPMHHPAMKVWAPIRAELGVRTMFNVLGPICNPAGVRRQLVGVYDRRWLEPLAHVLHNLGSDRAWIVHGNDGMDELSTTGATTVAELSEGNVRVFEVTPEDAGLPRVTLAQLKGGDAQVNARALSGVLAGEKGPYRDIVLLNSAAALIVAGRAKTLPEGVALAGRSIDDGKAAAALAALVAISTTALDA